LGLKTPVNLCQRLVIGQVVILWKGASRVMPAVRTTTSTGLGSSSTFGDSGFGILVICGTFTFIGFDPVDSVNCAAASSLRQ